MKVEELINAQLHAPEGTSLPKDNEIVTSCPKCHENQNLGEAKIVDADQETIYICKNGCQPIIIVGLPGGTSWPGRGFRLGSHVIRNISEVFIPLIGSDGGIKIPASPDALDRH